jgi:hypothetical protein
VWRNFFTIDIDKGSRRDVKKKESWDILLNDKTTNYSKAKVIFSIPAVEQALSTLIDD